ncbi:RHS repeat-associated core domain-containing protein [Pseudomonas orientalis]|uniref:Insecticidal toxin complex protein TccC n=1 Tax=Pseudomonas orientalis TaxID=76758 RepID=A0A1H2EX07_9PSED|nr:RHS repeat-associated core domain-containing protein [Pseudomonas orientalis]KRP67548.1 toxin [Pseudomonas orientalis]SDT99615.1 insecticidal toxin complex protein TccC [Pseudomonas orientalis]
MSYSIHRHTPSLAAIDPRGLIVRHIDYHRSSAEVDAQVRIHRQVFGSTGLMTEQWDPRLLQLSRAQPDTAPNQRTVYSLGGHALCSDSVDAGRRLTLMGEAGQVLEEWDGRGARQAHHYDQYLRPIAVFEQAASDRLALCVERLAYASSSNEETARNRCGRVVRHDDGGGSLFHEAYGLHAQVAQQTRRFRQAGAALDWPQPDAQRELRLEPERFETSVGFNALGERLHHTDAKGNRFDYAYGIDGQPASIFVTPRGGARKQVLGQRRYNAAGQVLSERAGNGVVRAMHYREFDGRLRQMTAHLPAQPDAALQDLRYDYDGVGNIVRIDDLAQPTQWSSNTRISPTSVYEYDTLSQLTTATGRETAGNTGGPALPAGVAFGSTDDSVWRRYTQRFSYDAAGNVLELQHVPSSGTGFTRRMSVAAGSNHFVPQADGKAAPGLGQGFDRNGNLQALAGEQMGWDVRNQLVRLTLVRREGGNDDEERYAYDATGQRILKRRLSQARGVLHTAEVRYLPGLEIRHDSATGEQLNVLNLDAGTTTVRVLLWDRHPSGGRQDAQIRYGLPDHLGSSCLELGEQAQLLSQESYYPYGGTAWRAARNASEASYRFIRYSGKERDASGLSYYGFRYYAPWLCRWISPDPAGDADGLNLYAMVGGNPVTQADAQGLVGAPALEASQDKQIRRLSISRRLATMGRIIRPRIQAASSAAIRDGLSTYIANAIATGVDLAVFGNLQATPERNQVLRYTVASLDALATMHMSTGIAGNWTRFAPQIGVVSAAMAGIGYVYHPDTQSVQAGERWDPVAVQRLSGHIRSLSRELVQQIMRGHGTGASWGSTALRARVGRTAGATAAYAVATVTSAVYGGEVPALMQPNVSPAIEAYDGAMGTLIRSGHPTAAHDPHGQTLQTPDPVALMHGGLSRMFNQVWTFWATTGVEALAVALTGQPQAAQSRTTRTIVMVARGVIASMTEWRGFVVAFARRGYTNLASSWRAAPRS